jgi:adenylosuccinate lyase
MDFISVFDGRYRKQCDALLETLSEYNYIKHRVLIEVAYLNELVFFIHGNNINIKFNINEDTIINIKEIEKITRHDVKAIEIYLKENISEFTEYIHLGLTSQDVNSLATSIMMWNTGQLIVNKLNTALENINNINKDVIIITRTHSQPAVPSKLNKEFSFHINRINNTIKNINNFQLTAKFGGAVGTLAAHCFVFKNKKKEDWIKFCDKFVESFGFKRTTVTTQIDDYTSYVEYLYLFKILIMQIDNLCMYIRFLIRDEYLVQKVIDEEVGSSTMPQKVNPIDFENLKGNVHLAKHNIDAICEVLFSSEYQRDLSDSTALRSLSTVFGYILIIIDSFKNGLSRLSININKINEDINNNYSVVLEGIQTKLKLLGYTDAYNEIKKISRGNNISHDIMKEYINNLNIKDTDKEELINLTPNNYLGIYN